MMSSSSSSNNNDEEQQRTGRALNNNRSSPRRVALARWLAGMGLLGLAAANLQTTLASNAAAVADAEQQQQQQQQPQDGAEAAVRSSMGLDLSRMPLNEALKAADREGVGKFGQRVLFEAATELPGSGVTSNGFKYTTKVCVRGGGRWMGGSAILRWRVVWCRVVWCVELWGVGGKEKSGVVPKI
jgi:hypothetical protein